MFWFAASDDKKLYKLYSLILIRMQLFKVGSIKIIKILFLFIQCKWLKLELRRFTAK